VPGRRLKVTTRGGKTLGEVVRNADDHVQDRHSTSHVAEVATSSALVAVAFGLTHGAVGGVALDTRCAIGTTAGPATVAMLLSWLRVHIPMPD
jgi:hypothetical protein